MAIVLVQCNGQGGSLLPKQYGFSRLNMFYMLDTIGMGDQHGRHDVVAIPQHSGNSDLDLDCSVIHRVCMAD